MLNSVCNLMFSTQKKIVGIVDWNSRLFIFVHTSYIPVKVYRRVGLGNDEDSWFDKKQEFFITRKILKPGIILFLEVFDAFNLFSKHVISQNIDILDSFTVIKLIFKWFLWSFLLSLIFFQLIMENNQGRKILFRVRWNGVELILVWLVF